MRTQFIGRLLLSFVLIASAAGLIGFQWNETHVFNPDWHPHARFHAVQLVWLGTCLSAAALWLLWRRSPEPAVTALVVAAFAVVLWGGELFAGLVSGTDPSPDPARPPVLFRLMGWDIYGNLLLNRADRPQRGGLAVDKSSA